MTDVGFYHLTRSTLDAVLPRLLEKAVAAGHRVRVSSEAAVTLKHLDTALWAYAPASFLPHAIEGETEFPKRQPVLLAVGPDGNANAADLLAVTDGVLPVDPGKWTRILYVFDGNKSAALARARTDWKAVRAMDGAVLAYWQESERGWQKAG
jgi:DNA polymerase III subunit chi